MTADILRLEWQPARPTLFGHPVAAQFLERCQPDERSQSFPDGRQDPLGPVGQTVAEGGDEAKVETEVEINCFDVSPLVFLELSKQFSQARESRALSGE